MNSAEAHERLMENQEFWEMFFPLFRDEAEGLITCTKNSLRISTKATARLTEPWSIGGSILNAPNQSARSLSNAAVSGAR